MTFVTYENQYFCLLAYHSLPKGQKNIDGLGYFVTEGDFIELENDVTSYDICQEHDMVTCLLKEKYTDKNFFQLDVESVKQESVSWAGFPQKKAVTQYHRSKDLKQEIEQSLSSKEDGIPFSSIANFLIANGELKLTSKTIVSVGIENKNVTYRNEGFKKQAYSFRGMSGGAIFVRSISRDPATIENNFVGIGLSYRKNTLEGVSKSKVTDVIKGLLQKR